MGLVQPLMDTDPDSKSPTKVVPDKVKCTSNWEATISEMEAMLDGQSKAPGGTEDVEVDVTGCANIIDTKLAEAEDPDATEYSSSFGDTESGNEKFSGLSEAEVESEYRDHNSLDSPFDSFGLMFQTRKKKLTSHWKKYIHPLMWRCKWAELKIREFKSQAAKYSKLLAAYDQRKQLESDQFTSEGFDSKSLPFSNQNHRMKAMKRRKRKRIEETTDVPSYMLNHNLFGYFENKRSDADSSSMVDDFGNPVVTEQNANGDDNFGISDDSSLLKFRDDDDSLEQILCKIEMAQSRVQKLKAQLDMVVPKNVVKFSSSENLSLLAPCDGQTSSAHSPNFSAGNGDAISVGAIYPPTGLLSEYEMGDLVLPESALSSFGEAVSVPDIIESTTRLLSAGDVTVHPLQTHDSCEDIMDDIPMHNHAAEGEMHPFKSINNQQTGRHQEPDRGEQEESTDPPLAPAMEADPAAKTGEQSALKSCLASDFHVPKNKRKRGERKAGSAGWNR